MSRFQRQREDGHEQRATTLELFFDLVFVFAITQVSHLLLEHLTWEGAGQALFVLLVVWWAWNYTTWVTNELDTESTVVRLLMIALMLASLLMAVAIPRRVRLDRPALRRLLRRHPGGPPRVPDLRGGATPGRSSASAPAAS